MGMQLNWNCIVYFFFNLFMKYIYFMYLEIRKLKQYFHVEEYLHNIIKKNGKNENIKKYSM